MERQGGLERFADVLSKDQILFMLRQAQHAWVLLCVLVSADFPELLEGKRSW
jgi:hypothetical protein